MAELLKDQAFVESVVKALVNHPEDVHTDRTVDDRGVLITLHINQEDMGYIIGRQGQTARALRILLKTVGAKDNARVNLKIYEPEELRREHHERKGFSPRPAASGMGASAPSSHGEAGMVTDEDLADLGI
ncbi:MAG: KH domain-containing protein [Patescibacteria group bacterium]